jgi:CRP-like cAMP-binding protein
MNEADQSAFKKCFLFRGFCDDEANAAYRLLRPTVTLFKKGDLLTGCGRASSEFCFLLRGAALVYRDPEHRVLLRRIPSGGCYGAATLFSEGRHSPTEIVAASSGALLSITEDALRDCFIAHPTSALNYISFLSNRIVFLNERIQDFSAGSAEAKIAKLLLSYADDGGIAEIPNLRAAADSMNLGRASLYRVLSCFTERKWIQKDGKTISILQPDKLKGILL